MLLKFLIDGNLAVFADVQDALVLPGLCFFCFEIDFVNMGRADDVKIFSADDGFTLIEKFIGFFDVIICNTKFFGLKVKFPNIISQIMIND